jgi:hypothetical protein
MQITQEMSQGVSPGQSCHNCNTLCRGHHTQLGPLFVEYVPIRLQGRIGSRERISLFMDTHPDSLDRMERDEVFNFFPLDPIPAIENDTYR